MKSGLFWEIGSTVGLRQMNDSWIFTSQNVCVDGRLQKLWIEVRGGKIANVSKAPLSKIDTDFGDLVVLPGIVDSHVHINEPGRTEWEGFLTATHAALAGGVTTLVDMPLNCIPVTTTAEALKIKLNAVKDLIWVDVGFWGGATPDHLKDLPRLLESGVLGVKSFMIDSGIPEFKPMDPKDIEKAMPLLARANLPYLFHAEWDQGESQGLPQGPSYKAFLRSRPKAWENHAIEKIISLAKEHNCKSHIVHLSSAEALPLIEKSKSSGVKISVETCPHYLLLDDNQVEQFQPQNEKTLFKCCPPIRDSQNREQLWKGLLAGTIDMVVSDHSPCTPELKRFDSQDFGLAWGGISSLQFTLPLLWTEGQKHGATLPQISKWISQNPSQMAGLEKRKGKISIGWDADFAVFDPTVKWTIQHSNTEHKNKGSPYQGRQVQGKVVKTFLRGKMVYDQGQFSEKPLGHFLLKGDL